MSRFGHEDVDLRQREAEKPQILQQLAPWRQGVRCGVRNPLVMHLTPVRLTQKQDGERRIHSQDIFHGVVLLLAAITTGLLSSVLGAHDAPLGAVMGKRGPSSRRRVAPLPVQAILPPVSPR